MLKRILLVFVAMLIIVVPIAAQGDSPDDCDLELLTDWLIIRQVGWSRAVAAIQDNGPQLDRDNIAVFVQARHALEDAPRPACADAAYIASIGRYDNYLDGFLLPFGGVDIDTDEYNARYERFNELVQTTILELEALVDVDIMTAAQDVMDAEAAAPTPAN